MADFYVSYYNFSGFGTIKIKASAEAITHLSFSREAFDTGEEKAPELICEAVKQLEEYFTHRRESFSLPLNPAGTAFQKEVWEALKTIPYGETRSYKEIAAAIGSPKACRAVGMANHNNPLAIVIPCHRVVGANGKLVGYAGGLDLKQKLLELEQYIP